MEIHIIIYCISNRTLKPIREKIKNKSSSQKNKTFCFFLKNSRIYENVLKSIFKENIKFFDKGCLHFYPKRQLSQNTNLNPKNYHLPIFQPP